jgi:hypothetical protein
VGSRRLTACAMARPFSSSWWVSSKINFSAGSTFIQMVPSLVVSENSCLCAPISPAWA